MNDKYPNIEAIVHGTISGYFNDWVRMRPEAKALLGEVEVLQAQNSALKAHLDREQQDHRLYTLDLLGRIERAREENARLRSIILKHERHSTLPVKDSQGG